ncbi:hypothetical protein [Paucisalibacillus sp. EB02]|uniref:hypothetical protein n=1 Tax=Paucisalibacillus sp. EB02 TaxID=1347087 RepID=UPI0005A6E331|nr:hypothetical protein [Paucisalibacillus sp. EB02]
MDSRKTKLYFTIFVVAALAICLISIFVLTNKVSNLENRMSEMVGLQHNVLNNVDSQSHSIRSALEDFQKQQNWLGEVDVIEEVYLLEYSGQKLINEVELDWHDGTENTSIFRIEDVEKRDDLNHILKVVYPNGEVFEKELKL